MCIRDRVRAVQDDGGTVGAGCGSGRRAEVRADTCPPGQAYCWMQCMSTATAGQCASENLKCLDPTIKGPTSAQEAACEGHHDPSCLWQCVPTPTPSPLSPSPSPPSPSPPPSPPPSPSPYPPAGYCQGGTSMYMQGFTWPVQADYTFECVVLLFESWTLDSASKFAMGCVGTVLMGILLEGIIFLRRDAVKALSPTAPTLSLWRAARVHVLLACVYGVQLTVGYLLMLVVMTYSTPLFMCAIAGLVIGHWLFAMISNWRAVRSTKAKAARMEFLDSENPASSVPGALLGGRENPPAMLQGITPCCMNECPRDNAPEPDTTPCFCLLYTSPSPRDS
eukprot:TRINITY_DN5943_c0_g1_i6.p1 TRINITY_DN5943_c0_g1~~TRINITY_DN5943_c0_g1_i6.p1  ORF type:complete len:336 (-),score=85.87 TRINITY_DN5943_c0_g1_i6:137-1144(-)